MEGKDYLDDFDKYLERHPEFNEEAAKRFRSEAEALDEDIFKFVMCYIVL